MFRNKSYAISARLAITISAKMRKERRPENINIPRIDQLGLVVSCQCYNHSCGYESGSGESQGCLCSSGHQRAALVGLWNRLVGALCVESDELIHFCECKVLKATGFESQVTQIVPL